MGKIGTLNMLLVAFLFSISLSTSKGKIVIWAFGNINLKKLLKKIGENLSSIMVANLTVPIHSFRFAKNDSKKKTK